MIRVAAKAITATIVPFLLFWAPSQAQAATAYGPSASFGAGTLNSPQRIAVDQNTGNLFVVSATSHQIRVYKPTEDSLELLTTFGDATVTHRPVGIAIDRGTGNIYVTRAGRTTPAPAIAPAIVKFNQFGGDPPTFSVDPSFTSPTQGSGTGQFGSLGAPGSGYRSADGGIAVDPIPNPDTGQGNILIADPQRNLIHAFTSTGAPASVFANVFPTLPKINTLNGLGSGAVFGGLRDIAIAGNGDLLVADSRNDVIRFLRFGRDGTFLGALEGADSIPGGSVTGVGSVLAVDQSNGDVFASAKSSVQSPAVLQQFENDIRRFTLTTSDNGFNGGIHGVAIYERSDDESGRLYATASNNFILGTDAIQIFEDEGDLVDPPEIEVGEPTAITATSARVSAIIDTKGADVTWVVRYRPAGTTNWQSSPVQALEGNPDPQSVSLELVGLESNLEYEVSIEATNPGGTNASQPPNKRFKTLAAAPGVQTGAAWSISDQRATFSGLVNPRNSETEYFAEYRILDDDEIRRTEPVEAGSGGGNIDVAIDVRDLAADTDFLFRVVARNEFEQEAAGEWKELRTRKASESFLPKRGYELASAQDTNGVAATPWKASADGERLAYETFIPSPGATAGSSSFRVSQRQANGSWKLLAHNADPPGLPGHYEGGLSGHPAYSETLRFAAFGNGSGYDPDDQNGDPLGSMEGLPDGVDIYLRDVVSGSMTWLSRDPRISVGTPQTDPLPTQKNVRYISSDGQQVLFVSKRRLLDEDVATGDNETLYEWNRGALRVVAVMPNSSLGSQHASDLGSLHLGVSTGDVKNAVSADGRRIVFQTGASAAVTGLYLRLDGTETRDVAGTVGARFVGADRDVENVIYLRGESLYVYDVSEDSRSAVAFETGGAGISRVLGFSEDVNRVFFVSTKELADGGDAGSPNLYLAERPAAGGQYELRFIAKSDPAEDPSGGNNGWNRPAIHRELRTAADGSFFVFRSRFNHVPGRHTGGLPQIYVYEPERSSLSCISCPPDGSTPEEHANLVPSGTKVAGKQDSGPFHQQYGHPFSAPQRNVSTNGSIFFQTATALDSRDSNTRNDVYEWRGGELQLVSGGTGDRHSMFGDASVDGSTVFFRSAANLIPGLGLVSGVQRTYAARVGGGYVPPPADVACAGEDCNGGDRRAPEAMELSTRSVRTRPQSLRPEPRGNCRKEVRKANKSQRKLRRINRRMRQRGKPRASLRKRRVSALRQLRAAKSQLNSCRKEAR